MLGWCERLLCQHHWGKERALHGDERNLFTANFRYTCLRCGKQKYTATLEVNLTGGIFTPRGKKILGKENNDGMP